MNDTSTRQQSEVHVMLLHSLQKVVVFAVHEEQRIEDTDAKKHLATDKPSGGVDPMDAIVAEASTHDRVGGKPRCLDAEITPKRLHIDLIFVRRTMERRNHANLFMLIQQYSQAANRFWQDIRILVEKEDHLAISLKQVRNGDVVSYAEPGVSLTSQQLNLWMVQSHQISCVVRRAVVNNHHGHRLSAFTQRR